MNKWTFQSIDHDDPKGPIAIFDYEGRITVKVNRHLKYTAVNDETGYSCNIPSGEANEIIEKAREKLGIQAETPIEIKIEIQSEEKTADDIEVCPYPNCRQPIGTRALTATFRKCPHCDRPIGALIEIKEDTGIVTKTREHGTWV